MRFVLSLFSLSLFWWILRAWYNHLIVYIWWRFPLEGFKRIYQGWLDVIHSRQQQGWKRYSDQVPASFIIEDDQECDWFEWEDQNADQWWSQESKRRRLGWVRTTKTWSLRRNKVSWEELKSWWLSSSPSSLSSLSSLFLSTRGPYWMLVNSTIFTPSAGVLTRTSSSSSLLSLFIIIIITIIIFVPLLFPRGDHCDSDHDGGGVEHEAGQILWIARKFKNNCWRQLQGKICVTKCRL